MIFGSRGRHRAAKNISARTRRPVAVLTVASLGMLGSLVLQGPARAAAASPGITLTKTAPSSILAGEPVSFTLTAANPSANAGAAPEYNTSLRDVLPRGVTYVAGSTTPSDIGEPTIVTDANGVQTLIWRDAFDLQVDATAALTFTANVDNTLPNGYPVGSTILNTGNAYASTAPRYVPRFDATGAPVANANVQSATSNQTSTSVSALKITKDEPSPEAKLLRGVHDQTTVYTVKVTNTSKAATNTTTVTDYLPAQEEFLGCGQVDNSAGVEYPGAPSLTATPAVSTNCPTPVSVDTVSNPPANGSVTYPPGVYTKVVWNLGTLAAGQTVTINYAVGIPLRQNVLFAGGPTAASGKQAANLDNNTGASTRQNGDAAAQTNYVHAAGVYTGPIKAGGSANVVADNSHTVTVNDLRVYKSVSPGEFVAGQVATYTLHVDSGEYTDNSAITITDVLPNGICPLDDVSNNVTGAPAECAPSAGFAPSNAYQSVTQNADGTFTVVFQPITVAKDGSTVITYKGRNRTVFTGGSLAGDPPSAGDSFTNRASEQGTSTPVAATGFTGTLTVRDSTSATQTTSFGSLDKTVGARATPMDCSSATYGTTNPVFAEGDRVCFQIQVPFSTTNQTRNAVVTDFLPDNTSYESGSVTYPAANTVDPAQINFDSSGAANGALSWKLGANQSDGSTEVPVGKTFVARFSAIITAPAAGPAPDKPGNIVKLRTTNSAGSARSLRDGVDFRIAAAPPVSVLKGVESVNGGAGNPANIDGVTVKEGDAVRFRIDVKNNGTSANSNDVPIDSLTTWDVLPAGITCAQISAISGGGTCTDPGDAAQPSFTGNGTRSAIVFPGVSGSTLAAGSTRTVIYTMTIPAGVSVSTVFTNTAAVRSYTTTTDVNTTATHYPTANIDTSVPATAYDVPAATDNSNVKLPDVAVSKGVVSAVNETGNVGNEGTPAVSTQAVPGEQATFTVTATIPRHTTVFNGKFTDSLPPQFNTQSFTGSYRPDATSAATATLPAGVTFTSSLNGAPSAKFDFGTTYDNTSDTDQVFTIVVVTALSKNTSNGTTASNTGTFASATAATGGTVVPTRSASATVNVVEPAPTLTKTNDAGSGGVSGGQTITYTLKATNAASRPPLHDAWQLDCLPNGLTFAAYGTPPTGVTTVAPVAGDGTNGCASGNTVLRWNLGDLAGGQTRTLTYTATVDATSAGKKTLTNTASVSGNDLAGTRTGPTDPGNSNGKLYTASANSNVTLAGATALKSVSPTSAVPGQTVTYSTSAVLPAGVNFYNLSLIDTLPAGIDPNSVTQTNTTCTNADNTACTPSSATALSKNTSGTSTVIGWLLGDSGSASQVRTVTVTYTATVAGSAATAGVGLTNRMHVSWDDQAKTPPTSSTASFNQTSPDATATVTVLEPSLSLAKSVANAHPQPGQSFGYTLNVANANTASTSSAYNVTVTDTVPTGVVVDPASISNGGTISGDDSSTGGGTISWTIAGPLAKNASTSLTYSAKLAPSSTLTTAGLSNTARITGYDSLPAGGRHYTGPSSSAVVAPYFPKLTTAKSTPDGTTAYVGESFHWRVQTTDTGNGTAYQVGGVDTLPANWTYDTGTAQVSVNGGPSTQVEPTLTTSGGRQKLTWTGLGTLPPGTSLTIDYTATPNAGVKQDPGVGLGVDHVNSVVTNAQDATGATGNKSDDYGSNAATATAHIASTDLSIAKTVGTAPTAGRSGSWVLTVTNNGPDTATGPFTVTDDFTDPIPAGISNVQADGTGWSCTNGTPISCTHTGTLAKGDALPPITVTYDVDSTVADGRKLTNTASVTLRSFDADTTNNSDTANTTVSTSADIAITKDLSSSELVAGAPVSYRLTVSNAGPSSAAGPITVTETVPVGTTFVSAGADGWDCDSPAVGAPAGTSFTCSLDGPLTVGGTPAELIVTVKVASGRTDKVSNTATVESATDDPDTDDNSDTISTIPLVRADVKIQKTHRTDPFVAGDPVDYQFDVTNNGPSDASDVEVTDTLPDGLTYSSSASDDDWTCSANGQDVTCDLAGALEPGTSVVTITVDTDPDLDVSKKIINTATVTTSTDDPVPGNNSDDDDSTVQAKADLSIVKTDSGTTTAGEGLTYHLAVRNKGPSDVPGTVTVTDALPAGLTYVSATGSGWDCGFDRDSRVVTCTLAAGLKSKTDATDIDIVTTVQSSVGKSTITNTADVSSDIPDPVVGNNSSTDPVDIVTEANVSLTKELTSASPVLAGTDATFTLVASNDGPSDATNVSVVDHLPQYMTFRSFTGVGWDCQVNGQDVSCSRDTIEADTSAPKLMIIARVSASTPVDLPDGTTTLENTADIDTGTPGTSTNPDPVDVPVQAKADLSLTKKAKEPTVVAGQQMTWQLAVHNDGPSDASTPLTVTDTLPLFQTYVSTTAPWTCTAGDVPDPVGSAHQTVTCTLDAGLADDADAPGLDIVTQVDTSAPAGDVTNSATVTSATPGDDGKGEGPVTVTRTAALKITKTHTGTGTVGGDLAFSLRVHNDGPSVADQIVVTDALPVGLDYKSATGDGWTCAQADRTVTCTLAGTLAPGGDAAAITLTTTVRAAAFPSVTNTAVVSSTDPALPGSAKADDTVAVDPSATLKVTKEHVGTFKVGERGTYRLTVVNTGPTLTPGPVELTDDLPAGLTYVDATGDGWTCSAIKAVVSCRHDLGLAVDEKTVVTLTVQVGPSTYPSVTNSVTATATGAPPASASDTAPVTPTSTLAIVKKVASLRGDVVTYDLAVTDKGPNDTVTPVVVTDPLPQGLRFDSATGSGWKCTDAGRTVTCTHAGALAVGETTRITLVATVTAGPGTTVVNVATVGNGASPVVDSNPAKIVAPRPDAAGHEPDSGSDGTASTGTDVRATLALAGILLLLGLVLMAVTHRGRRRTQ